MPAQVTNKGNLITRRGFAGENGERSHRMTVLNRLVNKSISVCYKYMQEVGMFGSGIPSPMHLVCEMIRALEELDIQEGCEISTAREMAEYPLRYLRQLRGEITPCNNPVDRMISLVKSVSDANFILRNRELRDVSPGELKDISSKLLDAANIAHELGVAADEQAQMKGKDYPGAPVQQDRARREAVSEI
jgi:hypothetical protein